MQTVETIYWMPTNEPSFIMPLYQMQVAGTIKTVKGQKLDNELYYWLLSWLLSDRVQEMIDA